MNYIILNQASRKCILYIGKLIQHDVNINEILVGYSDGFIVNSLFAKIPKFHDKNIFMKYSFVISKVTHILGFLICI